MVIDKCTYIDYLRAIQSGIALDIAKNHTGVTIWDGNSVETIGFALSDYTDCHAECRLRLELKERLESIVSGKHFQVCVLEDVYGGENFHTTRQLLALNTVMDELILSGVVQVDEFYRQPESVWMKDIRAVYKQGGKLNPKYEVQCILEYLEFPFFIENCGLSDSAKLKVFFEDICDSAGMLIGKAASKVLNTTVKKQGNISISQVTLNYLTDWDNRQYFRDKRNREADLEYVTIDPRNIEKSILAFVNARPDTVFCSFLAPKDLGTFGLKHGIEFEDSEEGYLLFHKK